MSLDSFIILRWVRYVSAASERGKKNTQDPNGSTEIFIVNDKYKLTQKPEVRIIWTKKNESIVFHVKVFEEMAGIMSRDKLV